MRRHLAAASMGVVLVGLLGLVLAANAAGTAQFKQTFDFTYSPAKKGKSIGIAAGFSSTDPGLPGSKPDKAVTRWVTTLNRGTDIRTAGVYGQCRTGIGQLQAGQSCPASSRNGGGSAILDGTPAFGPTQFKVTAFNARKSILFLLESTGPPVQRFAFKGTFSGLNLSTNIPRMQVFGVPVVITQFDVTLERKRSGGKNYLTAPGHCGGRWTTKALFAFSDGSESREQVSQRCR